MGEPGVIVADFVPAIVVADLSLLPGTLEDAGGWNELGTGDEPV